MTKVALVLVVVVLAVAIQGAPTSYDEIIEAAKTGNWDQFQALLNANFASQPSWRALDFQNVRNLKPPQGGNVYGEAEYTFHSSSNFNGRQAEESGGHKIVNDNGKVNEFDFKPQVPDKRL